MLPPKMLKQTVLFLINGCKMVEMKPNMPFKPDFKTRYNPRADMIGGAIIVGVLCVISFIFLYTINMQPTRADWDFKLIFTILFITNLIFGIAIVGLIAILLKRERETSK